MLRRPVAAPCKFPPRGNRRRRPSPSPAPHDGAADSEDEHHALHEYEEALKQAARQLVSAIKQYAPETEESSLIIDVSREGAGSGLPGGNDAGGDQGFCVTGEGVPAKQGQGRQRGPKKIRTAIESHHRQTTRPQAKDRASAAPVALRDDLVRPRPKPGQCDQDLDWLSDPLFERELSEEDELIVR
jgi:hypothetical protein